MRICSANITVVNTLQSLDFLVNSQTYKSFDKDGMYKGYNIADGSYGTVEVVINKIKKMYPAIVTPMVKTPSKGLHIYFQYNPRLRSTSKIKLDNKSIGWDVLNNGRQVVAPPSKGYKWMLSIEETPLAKMPEWLEIYIKMLAAQS